MYKLRLMRPLTLQKLLLRRRTVASVEAAGTVQASRKAYVAVF